MPIPDGDISLLLGNGFSIAWDEDIFDYDVLYNAAEFPERLQRVFETVGTTDFEAVMRRLDEMLELLPHYGDNDDAIARARADSTLIRASLIQALRQSHPPSSQSISDEQAEKCAAFLAQFSTIYTTNYDLLLYWVIVRHVDDGLRHLDDGFRGRPLIWQAEGAISQNVFYLHGALHLYDDGRDIVKLRYNEQELMQQIADRLEERRYPLFVSEGSWNQKLRRIRHSSYLSSAYASLISNDKPLVVYGTSLKPNDRHIQRAIEQSRTSALHVFYYDDLSDEDRDVLKERFRTVKTRLERRLNRTVPLTFAKASVADIW